jgi:3-methylcrotonyl-CoA carboxylase beta subunit
VIKAGALKKNETWTDEKEKTIRNNIVEKYDKEGHAYYASARLWDDGIIMPEDTRKMLGLSLMISLNQEIPDTKHGVFRM